MMMVAVKKDPYFYSSSEARLQPSKEFCPGPKEVRLSGLVGLNEVYLIATCPRPSKMTHFGTACEKSPKIKV